MFGLPTETEQDLDAMVDLVSRITTFGRGFRRDIAINLSINPFVPRPDTPFQWCAQDTPEAYDAKIDHLRKGFRALKGKLHIDFGDPRIAFLEGLLSRGDRRLGQIIETAWKNGAAFDAWRESFRFDVWQQAIAASGLDPADILYRSIPLQSEVPWRIIDAGVSTDFLREEYASAEKGERLPTCRETGCHACGIQEYLNPCPTSALLSVANP
jgi:hypothetical protein